jgi:hypothetical protein
MMRLGEGRQWSFRKQWLSRVDGPGGGLGASFDNDCWKVDEREGCVWMDADADPGFGEEGITSTW